MRKRIAATPPDTADQRRLIGAWLKEFLRGGADMGTLTLSRFFVAHVLLVPAAIFGFVAIHVVLFRKVGAAGPISEDPMSPKLPPEPFYPKQVIVDGIFALVIILVMAAISHYSPFELGPKANPADAHYLPRPEWYYIPIFQWLKYWPESLSFLGVVVIPSLVAFFFASLPFLDRAMERRPWKRPFAVGCYVCIFLALFGLGGLSYRSDHGDPGYDAQLKAQSKATEDYMKAPFEEEVSGAAAPVAAIAADPLVDQGSKLFASNSCNACHGDGGTGGPAGPALTGIHKRFDADHLTTLLKSPTAKMSGGGMQPVDLPADQMKALIAYLGSL